MLCRKRVSCETILCAFRVRSQPYGFVDKKTYIHVIGVSSFTVFRGGRLQHDGGVIFDSETAPKRFDGREIRSEFDRVFYKAFNRVYVAFVLGHRYFCGRTA